VRRIGGGARKLPDDFDRDTPEERVAALVDAVKRDPRCRDSLVELLPERISLYACRGTNATIRMRGYIIAAFEQAGLPDPAVPYVLEELESGRDAYLVAAAARAIRGLEGPTDHAVPFLLKAIENIKYSDDAVSFDSYRPGWPVPSHTTAIEEIMKTFAWLGEHARPALPALEALREDRGALSAPARAALEAIVTGLGEAGACCCTAEENAAGFAGGGHARAERPGAAVPVGVELEDQDGRAVTFGGFLTGRPSIVVFFYTRCTNPNKCSLTITKLARLQRALRQRGLQGQLHTAAITYDPGFDVPARLSAYGQNRGVVFGDSDRFLRTKTGFGTLQEYFQLGVNFGPALVNRHRIELFILDREGRIAVTFTRLQWDVQDVLDRACTLVTPMAPPNGDDPAGQSRRGRPAAVRDKRLGPPRAHLDTVGGSSDESVRARDPDSR
jgi:cytochrome oxidase Cu insertion factor (SCO1/SenC/PrrC family)